MEGIDNGGTIDDAFDESFNGVFVVAVDALVLVLVCILVRAGNDVRSDAGVNV
jgi:hypothetical protein